MNDFETETPGYRREGFAPEPVHELHLDPQHVLVLSGRVIEVMRCDMPSSDLDTRFHVRHVAVEMKPKRSGNLELKIGIRRDGGVWNLNELEVPQELADQALEFFGEAKRQASL